MILKKMVDNSDLFFSQFFLGIFVTYAPFFGKLRVSAEFPDILDCSRQVPTLLVNVYESGYLVYQI